jgi:hypothetical protein
MTKPITVPEPVEDEEMIDVKPIAEDKMLRKNRGPGICQVLRTIYAWTDDPRIKFQARVATAMARKMTAKLRWYKEEMEKKNVS